MMVEQSNEVVYPDTWTGLSAAQCAGRLVDLVADHVDSALWDFNTNTTDAIVDAASTVSAEFTVTEALPPASSGMITTQPMAFAQGEITVQVDAMSWGPGPTEMGPGMYCTLWSRPSPAHRAASPHSDAMMVRGSFMMPFLPVIPIQLTTRADTRTPAALIWRVVAAAWTLLNGDEAAILDVPVDDGIVHTVSLNDPAAAARTIIDDARPADPDSTTGSSRPPIEVDHSYTAGGHDPVFAAGMDTDLPEDARWLPRLHRYATDRMIHLSTSISDRYPGIWSVIDSLGLQAAWPQWCHVPVLDTAQALVERYGLTDVAQSLKHAHVIAGVAAWRAAGRHAINLDGDTYQRFRRPGAADASCPTHLPDALPVNAMLFTGYTRNSDCLAYLNKAQSGPETAFVSINHGRSDLDTTAAQVHGLILAPGSVDGAFRKVAARINSTLGERELSEFIAFYTPILRTLDGLTQPTVNLIEAGYGLERRPRRTWPDSAATPADELTLWLTTPDNLGET